MDKRPYFHLLQKGEMRKYLLKYDTLCKQNDNLEKHSIPNNKK